MRRKVAVFAAAFTLMLAIAMSTVAAGGACLAPVGQPTNGTGLTVSIVNCTFGPTILHAPVGSTITWSNVDSLPHAIAGAGWTANAEPFGMFNPGTTVSYTFKEAGIYQYMCHLHPGMAGVVMIGDVAFPGQTPVAPAASA